ncbi:MAG TPA: hypothetical protein VGD94_19235 [Vicinamibacterales bacterium]
MKLLDRMKKAFTTADHAVKAIVGAPEAPRTYGRWNRNPMNADQPLQPGDVVLPSGQVVSPDSAPPPGERIALDPFASSDDYSISAGQPLDAERDAWENGGAVDFMRRRMERIER